MLATRPLGQGAASKKYDVLTALGAHACAGSKHRQKLILRFITLITARYNWQRDELSVGRAEMARLWQVDERTVKRELAKLRSLQWLTVKRVPARGRVAVYAIDWHVVLNETRPEWRNIGPDFSDRLIAMTGGTEEPEPTSTVVAFPAPPLGDGIWARTQAALHQADPVFFANWLMHVECVGLSQGILELAAPTAFHAQYLNTHALQRLLQSVQDEAPQVHRIFVRKK
ncbi:MAG: hypothetical protein KDA73_10770 [Rhodobacteraceae bacterium]|nr:hypothetical protein [Paracoccaceae bacterium]